MIPGPNGLLTLLLWIPEMLSVCNINLQTMQKKKKKHRAKNFFNHFCGAEMLHSGLFSECHSIYLNISVSPG